MTTWIANGKYVYIENGRNIAVATEMKITNLIKQGEEYEIACAHARLIASAPEMLEALKIARDMLKPFTFKNIGAPNSEARAKQDTEILAYEEICKVIAKAEGVK